MKNGINENGKKYDAATVSLLRSGVDIHAICFFLRMLALDRRIG
jgi:hypothetical protein